jgi:thiamine-phosphate pyrophosphorylase
MSEDKPRLYLITPPIVDAVAFAPLFEAALDAGDIACVWLRTEARDESTAKKIIRTLAPLAQARGAACLVDDPQLAVRADADGVHIEGPGEAIEAALERLRPGRIVGVGGLTTRDAAMTAGEADVDYLMFGGPGTPEPADSLIERVAWWAEIFNVPCVGFVSNLDDIAEFARAGADFIALCDAVWNDPRGIATAVLEAGAALAKPRETA